MKQRNILVSAAFCALVFMSSCSAQPPSSKYDAVPESAVNDIALGAAPENAAPESPDGGDESRVVVSYNVEISEELADSKLSLSSLPCGDMTLTNATLLNTGSADEIGPMTGGKLLTYRRVGNTLYNFFYDSSYHEALRMKSTDLQLSLLDLSTNESEILTTIRPLEDPYAFPGLNGTYLYLVYTPFPEEASAPQNMEEFSELYNTLPQELLRINVKTGSISRYPLDIPERISQGFPVGTKYLLLQSHAAVEEAEAMARTSEVLYLLDFSTGALREFHRMEYSFRSDGTTVFPPVILSPVSASEDKLYFMTITQTGSETVFGFRVYDSSMNFLDGVDVARFSGASLENYYPEMGVSNQNIYYKINSISDKEDSLFRHVPTTAGYQQTQYFDDSGMTLYTVNPRNNTLFDYAMFQTADSSGNSFLSLSNSMQNLYYQLKIDFEGFVCPSFINGGYSVTTDYEGNLILRSHGSDHYNSQGLISPFKYFYVPKEELYRALYGGESEEEVYDDVAVAEASPESESYEIVTKIITILE